MNTQPFDESLKRTFEQAVSSPKEITEEFPEGKESYCPQCYFNEDLVILRKDCRHNKTN